MNNIVQRHYIITVLSLLQFIVVCSFSPSQTAIHHGQLDTVTRDFNIESYGG